MTPKQRLFVQEYLTDPNLNATAAYKRAGYKARGNSAEVNASKLLRNTKIAAAIQQEMDKRAQRTEITADYVLKGIREVAERCMQRVPVMVGQGENRHQLKDDETGEGVWSFDSSGANKSFELLGKHLKLFTEKHEHGGTVSIERIERKFVRPNGAH